MNEKLVQEIECMDAVRARLDVTFAEAKQALDAHGGDVAKAIVYLEEKGASCLNKCKKEAGTAGRKIAGNAEEAELFAKGLVEQIKAIIKEGNVTKVRLIKDDKTIVEIPATLGMVGIGLALFSPLLLVFAGAGALTALYKEMVLEIEKADGSVESRNLKIPFCKSGAACEAEETKQASKATNAPGADNAAKVDRVSAEVEK